MIFFALAMSLLLEPQTLQAQPVDAVGYIQNVKTETVVLVSNNILSGEISSYQEENPQNYLGSSPLVINLENNQFLYNKNKTQLIGCFIHNLSTNNQKVQQIRAT